MIKSIASFRFIIAFIIFLFHLNIHLQWRVGVKIIDKFFQNGAAFMTGFFILSGFIMTHVYQNTDFTKRENIFNYYIKRFAKIYPIYAIGTIVFFTYASGDFFVEPLGIIVNDIFLVQAFFPSMFDIGLNGGTWSLTVEIFLYFLFPLLMILLNKSIKKTLLIGFIITFIVSLNAKINKVPFLVIYTNPACRLGDFLLGIGTYFALEKFKHEQLVKFLHKIVVLLLFCTVVFLAQNKYQYMLGQVLLAPLFGFWIYCVYYSKSWLYNNKFAVYFGKISYSFYIWQFFAIEFGKYLMKSNLFHMYVISLMCFSLNILLSMISYHIFEEPLRKIIINKIFSLYFKYKYLPI